MEFIKDKQYYNYKRIELLSLLPEIKGRFLEIGCSGGATLKYLKSNGASYVAGIDISKEAIDNALRGNLDYAAVLDVEKDVLQFEDKEFNCIIFADVIEHLYNPWKVLKETTRYLKDDGYVLLSIPNVKYYQVLKRLIFHDEWPYVNAGILDNTHIRFFTLKEIHKLLAFADLKVERLGYNAISGRKFNILNKILFNQLNSFKVMQYHILAGKK